MTPIRIPTDCRNPSVEYPKGLVYQRWSSRYAVYLDGVRIGYVEPIGNKYRASDRISMVSLRTRLRDAITDLAAQNQ